MQFKDFINRKRKSQLEKYLATRTYDTSIIENTIEKVMSKIISGVKSNLIYGQPQSGKTDMMTALCCKLFDTDTNIIILLSQDNTELEEQNRKRFSLSGINPSPVYFRDILDDDVDLRKGKYLISCTKNSKNLEKLIAKLGRVQSKVIIDDETDYATPNSKVNRGEQTKINEHIVNLCKNESIFIGVTATPARNDLNNTLNTNAHDWVEFEAHKDYKGYEFFFPNPFDKDKLRYNIVALKDYSESLIKEIRQSFFEFCINVAYLNITRDEKRKYIMLIHNSGKISDHKEEKKTMEKIKRIFSDINHSQYESYYNELLSFAKAKCKNLIAYKENDSDLLNQIMIYVTENITSTNIGVLDSEGKKNLSSTKDFSEEPVHTFTVTIGGNIMSRGITFKNLLSMFFTRNAKKMQQATYQQRARLFGNRPDYMMSHFTLTITDELFEDWWEIFSLYELYLVSARAGRPIYPQTSDKIAVPYASIDKSTVSVDRGSLSLAKRKYTSEFDNLIKDYYDKKINIFIFLDKVSAMTDPLMEKWFVDYLNKVAPSEDDYVLHESGKTIEERYKDADSVNISRTKGGIFSSRMIEKYPDKSIHLWPVKNNQGEVRLWYKNTVSDKVTWLKNKRSNKKKFEGNFPS